MHKTEARILIREARLELSAISHALNDTGFSSDEAKAEWISDRLDLVKTLCNHIGDYAETLRSR